MPFAELVDVEKEIERLEKGGPIAIADRFVTNNGSADELMAQVRAYMASL